MNPRRLYRSRDRQLAGVAGGMAEYLEIDPTVVRILWIIVGIASGGLALLAYIILALVIPNSPWVMSPGPTAWARPDTTGDWAPPASAAGWAEPGTPPAAPTPPAAAGWNPGWSAAPQPAPVRRAESGGIGAGAIIGVVLIVFGAIALADAALPGWVFGAILGPAVVLALGLALVVSSLRGRASEAAAATRRGPAEPSTPGGEGSETPQPA